MGGQTTLGWLSFTRLVVELDELPDIALMNVHPRIPEGRLKDPSKRAASPRDDGRHEFRDCDPGVGAEHPQRGAESKAHAQSPDEDVWAFTVTYSVA